MLANGFIEMKFPIKPDESGGEPARIPNASRGSRTPGSREASGLRVALAPLSALFQVFQPATLSFQP
jgi:hypothetical protein